MNKDFLFRDYLDYWLENYCIPNNAVTTCSQYDLIIKRHIIPALGHLKLSELNGRIIQEYINSLKDLKRWTLVYRLKIINAALNYAVDMEIIDKNPARKVLIPKNSLRSHVISHSDEEMESILDFDTPIYFSILLGYHTGLRAGELSALTWNDVDFANKTISVNKSMFFDATLKKWFLGKTKNSSSVRVLPIHDKLLSILEKQLLIKNNLKYDISDGGLIFPADNGHVDFINRMPNGRHLHPVYLAVKSRKISRETSIPFTFHKLRHTYATKLIESGADIVDVQKRLGHTSAEVTLRFYVHPTQKMSEKSNLILNSF